MARGVNKVILIGHLGNEPKITPTKSGGEIVTISLATSYSTKNKQTGEWQDATEWHRVVFYDKQAEIVAKYLHKGSRIYVEGRLQTRKWQDQGEDRYITEIIANEMQMLSSKRDERGAVTPIPNPTYLSTGVADDDGITPESVDDIPF